MKNGATRQRLLKIADAVENWRTMRQDDAGVAVFVSTPGDAMRYIASTILNAGERAVVQAALPTITTGDFAEAAQQIRQTAERLELDFL